MDFFGFCEPFKSELRVQRSGGLILFVGEVVRAGGALGYPAKPCGRQRLPYPLLPPARMHNNASKVVSCRRKPIGLRMPVGFG